MSTTPTPKPTASAYPKVFFDRQSRLIPKIVYTQDEERALGPDRWTMIPAQPRTGGEPEYPKIMANVNLLPVIVNGPEDEAALGDSWIEYIPPELNPIPDVPPVTLDPTSASPTAFGGNGSFTVTMTGAGESASWTAEKDASADWLTINSPTGPQTADGTVYYSVAMNTGPARSAAIYVNGKTFTIAQAGV